MDAALEEFAVIGRGHLAVKVLLDSNAYSRMMRDATEY